MDILKIYQLKVTILQFALIVKDYIHYYIFSFNLPF